jgi:hypothetical protein
MSLQQPTPTAVAPPADASVIVVQRGGPPTANQMLEAARAQRSELRDQLDNAEERRSDLQEQLSQTPSSEVVTRAGIEARIKDTDARIAELDRQIADADARVATAASVPGATTEPPRPIEVRRGPPEEAWVLGGLLIVLGVFPMAIAHARRIWRRPASPSAEMPAELTDRLNRLEQAVDAVAVELERVGEGQRYVAKVFAESQGRVLGAGAAEPLDVREREAVRQSRP